MIFRKCKGKAIGVLAVLFLAGCYYDTESLLYPTVQVDCTTVTATFGEVKTIITQKCATAGCHDATAAGAVVLVTYDQVKAKAVRIKQRAIVERTMPPLAPLTADETATILCWIDSGMPNN